MSMTEWAEKEVELACKRECPDRKEGEWDYGCACYESALKAYKSLMADGHSGMSFSMTRQILIRLIEGMPLTPIEDTEDVWEFAWYDERNNSNIYQCNRRYSLFKTIYSDGTVKYSDNELCYCIDLDTGIDYHSNLASSLIHEMFPITMPYMPKEPIAVYCEEFLTDRNNGDFDTVGIFRAVTPDRENIDISRFFKDGPDDWIEIDKAEYSDRKLNAIKDV